MKKVIQKIPTKTREILIITVGLSIAMWVIGPANKILNVLCILGTLLFFISVSAYIALHFKKEEKKRGLTIQKERLIRMSRIEFLLFSVLAFGCLGSACFAFAYIINPMYLKDNGNNLFWPAVGQIIFGALAYPATRIGAFLGEKIGESYNPQNS